MDITLPGSKRPLSPQDIGVNIPSLEGGKVPSAQIPDILPTQLPEIALYRKNYIINGNFDIWQRNSSQTSSGYGSSDRWMHCNSGSSKTVTRQAFTVGQTDVPNNPVYFNRTVVTSSAGAANLVTMSQRVEGVGTLSGKTAIISFYAKADASRNISVEFGQLFGSGGSPSDAVLGIGVAKIAITSSWVKYTVEVSIPSIAGKTLGTNNDHSLFVQFWFDAGSDYNARTDSLGQQSGTFDIAQVQLEAGDIATAFDNIDPAIELIRCQRFFEKSYAYSTPVGSNTGDDSHGAFVFRGAGAWVHRYCIPFKVHKRVAPYIGKYSTDGSADNFRDRDASNNITAYTISVSEGSFEVECVFTTSFIEGHWIADAEI